MNNKLQILIYSMFIALPSCAIVYLFNDGAISDFVFMVFLPGIFTSINLFGGAHSATSWSIYMGILAQSFVMVLLVKKVFSHILDKNA